MKVRPIDLVTLLSDLKGLVPEMESFAFHQIHSYETVFWMGARRWAKMKVHPIDLVKFLSDLNDLVPEMESFASHQIHSSERVFWMGGPSWSKMTIHHLDFLEFPLLSSLEGLALQTKPFASHQI